MGIELDRTVDSIQVGHRHRADLGDIDALAKSISAQGLLQPLTITPDGVLVCGRRRLAAIQQLGWRTVSVWVRSGISDRLGHLLAEQDENVHRKSLTQIEAADLYRELKQLMAEDAERREHATRFSSDYQPGSDGGARMAPPSAGPAGKSRVQAARMVTGRASYTTLERIGKIEEIVQDSAQPEAVREQARQGLAQIEAGSPVLPVFERLHASIDADSENRQAQLHSMAEAAVARVTAGSNKKRPRREATAPGVPGRWPTAAFVQTWTSLTDWWTHYDPDELAAELTDEQAAIFLAVADGTADFAAGLRRIRTIEDTHGAITTTTAPENNEDDEDTDDDEDEGAALTRRHLRAL